MLAGMNTDNMSSPVAGLTIAELKKEPDAVGGSADGNRKTAISAIAHITSMTSPPIQASLRDSRRDCRPRLAIRVVAMNGKTVIRNNPTKASPTSDKAAQ